MRHGRKRTKALIEQTTESRDSEGGVVDTWSTYKTVWGELAMTTGGEAFRGRQTHASAEYVFAFDWIDAQAVTTKMRLNLGGRYFDILAVNNAEGRNREVFLSLRERGA